MQSAIPCPALLCLPFLRTTFLRPHPPCCETHPGFLRSTILRPTPSATHLLVTHPSSAHFPATPVPVARPSATHPTATRSSAMHLLRSTLLGPTMPSVSRIRTARLCDCILQSAFPGLALLCSVLPLMRPVPPPSLLRHVFDPLFCCPSYCGSLSCDQPFFDSPFCDSPCTARRVCRTANLIRRRTSSLKFIICSFLQTLSSV